MYDSDFWFLKIHHRDFCKIEREIFENHEITKNLQIGPYSRPFFYQIRLDMANKKYLMGISIGKGRKCMTQIFDFWKFITEIFAKLNERFSKIMKLRKIYKTAHFLGQFSTRYDWLRQIKNISWQSAWKREENVCFRFLIYKISSHWFCQIEWEIFNYHEIMKNCNLVHFLLHFSTRYSRIWQIKNILWRSAWKKEENVCLIFFLFEISSKIFLPN